MLFFFIVVFHENKLAHWWTQNKHLSPVTFVCSFWLAICKGKIKGI